MTNTIRLIALALAAAASLPGGAQAGQPTAVMELFTSQGCSSCPPADAILGEFADKDGVLALSYPVDYWDYLGWKDTLASHENTLRQKAYASGRGDGQVYTPQLVINGKDHVVGSNRAAIDAALTAAADPGLVVPVTMTASADATTVTIGAAPPGAPRKGTLWLVMYDRKVNVPIDRGENAGKTVTYNNVVRKLRPIAMWKGDPMTVDLPKSEMSDANIERCAVILQTESRKKGQLGPIIGAASIYYEE